MNDRPLAYPVWSAVSSKARAFAKPRVYHREQKTREPFGSLFHTHSEIQLLLATVAGIHFGRFLADG
jgi:hypothetical protein